jgi:putative transposase
MTKEENKNKLISLKQLADLSEVSYAGIRKRVSRKKYTTYQFINGQGYVDVKDPEIPDSVRLKFQSISENNKLIPASETSVALYKSQNTQSPSNELSQDNLKHAIAAARLVNHFSEFKNRTEFIGKKHVGEKKFISAYLNGAFPDIYEIIGKKSVKTLKNYETKYLNSGKDFRSLSPQYKSRKASSITPEESEVLIKLLLNPNKPLHSEVVRQAQNFFEVKRFSNIKSYPTYKRWLNEWAKNNYSDYVFYRHGEKGLDDLVLPYLERDWNKIEVGELLIFDGHVNNFQIINCFPNKEGNVSGKPVRMMTIGAMDGRSQFLSGYEIGPSENIKAITSALRRAILQMGMVPKAVYIDNGKAFLAKYFRSEDWETIESLFNRLQIKTIIATKYHAQSKNIEPLWKWMGELERMVPTYVGTSIEMQPPRMNRGEFIHRKIYEKAMQHTKVDIFAAHRAMAWWLDEYHNRKKEDGHLKGLTPAEVFNEGRNTEGILMPDRKTVISREELNYLMMDLHISKLYRKGIRMFGNWYWSDNLFGRQIDEGDEIRIKYDLLDQDKIFVYDKLGNLVCEANRVDKVHPAANYLGTKDEQEELKKQLALKEKLKTSIVGDAKKFAEEEIYPFVKKQLQDAQIIQIENIENNLIQENNSLPKKRKKISDRWKYQEDKHQHRKAN